MDFEITEEDLEEYTLKADIIDDNGELGYREQEKIKSLVFHGLLKANCQLEDVIVYMTAIDKTNHAINIELRSFIQHYTMVRKCIDTLIREAKERKEMDL
jgi:hypothetical protein